MGSHDWLTAVAVSLGSKVEAPERGPNMECVICVGIPATGKTTFYREHLASTHEHVSKDLIRNARRRVDREQQLIARALSTGRSLVIDNTNPSRADRAPLIALARAHGASVVGYYFEASTREAIRRNAARKGKERVPDVAIYTIASRLEPPAYEEGFDRLFRVRIADGGKFDVEPM